jgi:hypothetical protein
MSGSECYAVLPTLGFVAGLLTTRYRTNRCLSVVLCLLLSAGVDPSRTSQFSNTVAMGGFALGVHLFECAGNL